MTQSTVEVIDIASCRRVELQSFSFLRFLADRLNRSFDPPSLSHTLLFNMKFSTLSYLAALLLPSLITAQLSGTVGPTTSRAAKRATKVCNVLNYGGVASKTSDVGPAIASAFAACKSGGTGKLANDN